MVSIYQRLGFLLAGTTLSVMGLQVNSTQAAIKTNPATLQQGDQLQMRENQQLIAQAYPASFTTYYLTAQTNNTGSFTVAHGLPAYKTIYGISVAIQHTNGNWHTLEFSHLVDNRYWWNQTNVAGIINSANFYNRPVRIILYVSP